MPETRPRHAQTSLADLTGVTHVIRGLLALEPKRRKSRAGWVVFFGVLAVLVGSLADRSVREIALAKGRVVAARVTGTRVAPDLAQAAVLPSSVPEGTLPSAPLPEPVPVAAPAPAPAPAADAVVSWGSVARPAPAPASAPAAPAAAVKRPRPKATPRSRTGA